MPDSVNPTANMNTVTICFGERYRCIARPANYTDLQKEGRKAFPMMSSVSSLVVLFNVPGIPGRWVELAPDAYAAVQDGAVLYFNVQHPITKEYILPLPDQDPDLLPKLQISEDAIGRPAVPPGTADDDDALPAAGAKVSHRNSRPPPPPQTTTTSAFAARPGGDVCGSGWGLASERLRRSARLVPDLRECKGAVGLAEGESDWYPDEQTADDAEAEHSKQGQHQHYDACVPRCSHSCDCQLCEQKRAGTRPTPAFTTILPSLGDGDGDGVGEDQAPRVFTYGPSPAPGSSASNWNPRSGRNPQPHQPSSDDAWAGHQQDSRPENDASWAEELPTARRSAGRMDRAARPRGGGWYGGGLSQPYFSALNEEEQSFQSRYWDDQQNDSPGYNPARSFARHGHAAGPNDVTGYIQSPPPDALHRHPAYQGYVSQGLRVGEGFGYALGYEGYPQPTVAYQQSMPGTAAWSHERPSQQYGYGGQYHPASMMMAPSAVRSSPPSPPPHNPPPLPFVSSLRLNPARFETGSPLRSRAKARASSEWAASRNLADRRRGTTADVWGAPQQQQRQHLGQRHGQRLGGAVGPAHHHHHHHRRRGAAAAAAAGEHEHEGDDARHSFAYGDVDPSAGEYNTSRSARQRTASDPVPVPCGSGSGSGGDGDRASSAGFWCASSPPPPPRDLADAANATERVAAAEGATAWGPRRAPSSWGAGGAAARGGSEDDKAGQPRGVEQGGGDGGAGGRTNNKKKKEEGGEQQQQQQQQEPTGSASWKCTHGRRCPCALCGARRCCAHYVRGRTRGEQKQQQQQQRRGVGGDGLCGCGGECPEHHAGDREGLPLGWW